MAATAPDITSQERKKGKGKCQQLSSSACPFYKKAKLQKFSNVFPPIFYWPELYPWSTSEGNLENIVFFLVSTVEGDIVWLGLATESVLGTYYHF